MEKKRGVCVVGAFPPPVNGMSFINKQMADSLESVGNDVIRIDLSPGSLERTWNALFSRCYKSATAILTTIILMRRYSTLYLSVSSGSGQFVDICFVIIARVFQKRIVLHHHSFLYVDKFVTRAWILCTLAGRKSVHVVLCGKMGKLLEQRYSYASNLIQQSNAVFVDSVKTYQPRRMACKVGFLGNLTFEKGIETFVNSVAALNSEMPALSGVVAGPFGDERTRTWFKQKIDENSNLITYIGPIYGDEKAEFFGSIDLLLFPSTYKIEAEPVVIYEALSHGVPVVALNRGCIGEVLPKDCVVDEPEEFAEAVRTLLKKIYESSVWAPELPFQVYEAKRRESEGNLHQLLEIIAGENKE